MLTRMMNRRLIGLVSVAIWITACASPTVSVEPSPSASLAAEVCQFIELLDPSGERVNLNGTWEQVGGYTYYIYQEGDCVWITGGFLTTGDTPFDGNPRFGNLGDQTYLFDGHLRDDFTVVGRWALLLYAPGPGSEGPFSGTETWTLDFADRLTLRAENWNPLEKVSDRYLAP